jgi:hypothetical protein
MINVALELKSSDDIMPVSLIKKILEDEILREEWESSEKQYSFQYILYGSTGEDIITHPDFLKIPSLFIRKHRAVHQLYSSLNSFILSPIEVDDFYLAFSLIYIDVNNEISHLNATNLLEKDIYNKIHISSQTWGEPLPYEYSDALKKESIRILKLSSEFFTLCKLIEAPMFSPLLRITPQGDIIPNCPYSFSSEEFVETLGNLNTMSLFDIDIDKYKSLIPSQGIDYRGMCSSCKPLSALSEDPLGEAIFKG